ncbi:hypothetical protein [Pedobacter sp. ASV12]|uniref:hypothetical protein n=1 Tax=Pedobacter sp. ASV12 TaxID=2795120 RepID=UPI0018EB20BC|nr:hypothetical protein [Pedobacter sp. ASV12]
MKKVILLFSIVLCSLVGRAQVYAHLEIEDDYTVEENNGDNWSTETRGSYMIRFYKDANMTERLEPTYAITVLVGLAPGTTSPFLPPGVHTDGVYVIQPGYDLLASDVLFSGSYGNNEGNNYSKTYNLCLLSSPDYVIIP